jgi:hypothetical protein
VAFSGMMYGVRAKLHDSLLIRKLLGKTDPFMQMGHDIVKLLACFFFYKNEDSLVTT